MREHAYDSEDLPRKPHAKYPDLLAGEQLAGSPRRRLVVKWEAGVPDRETGGDRWSLDQLFIDQEAVPTLVEVKRSHDTQDPARGSRTDARLRGKRLRLLVGRAAARETPSLLLEGGGRTARYRDLRRRAGVRLPRRRRDRQPRAAAG
jgi:hypothetical protein